MKKLLTFAFLFMFAALLNAQILVENFDYPVGDALTAHGWNAHSGAGTRPISVVTGNLTYPGYANSGVGNMVAFSGGSSGEDINVLFTTQTSGTVYASILVNPSAATTTGDYFLHLGASNIGSTYRAKVFIMDDGSGKAKFGLTKGSNFNASTTTFTSTSYDYNSTILLVIAYKIVDGATNDTVKLFVNPILTNNEPAADLVVEESSQSDLADVGTFALRQSSQAYAVTVDGLKISASWSDVVPVELTSFNAVSNGNNVNVNWVTATETNNSGFELYRNGSKVTFIKGNGTTAERSSYSYTDKELTNGNYSYQLYQIDFDGTRSLVGKTSVEVNAAPVEFALNQNYPNPFNPSTSISFSIPNASSVKLTIYNAIGKEVATLVNGTMESGNHKVVWNASNMPSGMYFYKLQADNFTSTKKMMLIK